MGDAFIGMAWTEGTAEGSSGDRRDSHIHGHYAVRHSCARRLSHRSMDIKIGRCIAHAHADPGMNFNELLAASSIMAT